MILARRFRTDPITCVREWFFVWTNYGPEPIQTAAACLRAAAIVGALALPQITEHTRAGSLPVVTGSAIPASRVVRGSQSELVPTEGYVGPNAYLAAGGSPTPYSSIPAWTPATLPGLRTDNPVALSFAPAPLDVPEPSAWLLLAVPVLIVAAVRL